MRHAGQQGPPGGRAPAPAGRRPSQEGREPGAPGQDDLAERGPGPGADLEQEPLATPAPVPMVIIGAGKVAHAAHLREIRDLPDLIRPVAVIDPDPGHRAAVMAGFPRVAVCDTPEEATRAGAGAALVLSPWWTHKDVVLACLEARLPVLCEKPVSLDPAEIDELIAAERLSGVPVTAGYMKRHDPVVRLFIDHCRANAATARRIAVDIHDPNAPHLVDHLVPYPPPPFGPQPPPARAALARALGADSSALQREVYARGLGGSLIHQVNIVHAALDGTGRELYGSLEHSLQWAGGSAVSCRWRPDDDLVVEASHLRLPAHRRYRETLEFTGTDSVATLTLPSPYARDEGATLHIDTWDEATGLSTRRTHRAGPAVTGFREQLRAWTRSVSQAPGPGPRTGDRPLPGLREVREDALTVREAALRLT
ncbi:Gfo/Idh/MocA family protein [Streptomyces sp. NBC_01477]|uniref:Gfo/Idh/MocA family protein n=1 Tax=Streptomyces sp. NBC_01477 TaxID=2976015 RepID=UPI002E30A4DB|nr:Gfo/Idh/MocA family oxidoreductase [Streptomyces sp. NBC_01477]